MWSNRPQAKFCFKLDSNHLLIDFFDPKSSLDLIEIVATIQIRTRIWSKKLVYIKNWSTFLIQINLFDINRLFRSFNRLFWSLNRYFNQNRLKIDQKQSYLDWNSDCRLESVFGFRIGPKLTIEIGRLGIRIIANSMPDP